MSELRGGIVGAGTWSAGQLRAWQFVRGARIVAICDTDQQRRQDAAREFAIESCYASAAELLDRERLDFVDICTRPASHASLVRLAAQRRVHVLCQKPFCASLAAAQDAVSLAERNGIRLMVNENYRWQAWYRVAKEVIDSGDMGRPFLFTHRKRARITLPRFEHRQTYLQQMPRLVLFEVGVHYVDVLRYVFGEPKTVFAQTQKISSEIAGEDVASMVLGFGGATAVICNSWASFEAKRSATPDGIDEHFAPDCQIDGTTGTLSLFGNGLMTLNSSRGLRSWDFQRSVYSDSQRSAQQHFIDCLNAGLPFETSGRDTLKTLRVVDAAYESARTSQAVQLA